MEQTSLKQFLHRIRNPRTRNNYTSWLKTYFETLGVSPDDYFTTGRSYKDDIVDFIDDCEKNDKYHGKSVNSILGAVRSFLAENGIRFDKTFYNKLNLNTEAVTKDKIP
ncbi:MAG: hypothetical protein NTY91_03460 [Euryarchaeota archaeon]|nr:hypothetical protein [Euryarchaeota archaeon]